MKQKMPSMQKPQQTITSPLKIRNREGHIRKLQELKKELQEKGEEKINKTDPEATFMKTRSGIKTSYNSQAAVDEEHQIIIANEVTSEACNVNQPEDMVEQAIENTRATMDTLSTDAGFSSGENLEKLEQKGIDAYIPDREYQGNQRKGQDVPADPFHKDNFIYDEDTDTYTCPAGNTLSYSQNQKQQGKEPFGRWLYLCIIGLVLLPEPKTTGKRTLTDLSFFGLHRMPFQGKVYQE